MTRKLSERIMNVRPSPHRELIIKADELRRMGRKIYSFSAGQPGVPPNPKIIELFTEKLKKETFNLSKYSPPQGIFELREEISRDLKEKGKIDVEPDRIIITNGGVEGILLSLLALTKEGDEIFLLDPTYSVYWNLSEFLRLKVEKCPQNVENGYQPEQECLKEKITSKTRAILLVSPDNPTSRIISDEIAKLIYDLSVEKDSWLIYDVAYKNIIYEGQHVWLERYDNANERVISVNSFSKDLNVPGFRLGYSYGPKEVIKAMTKIKGFTSITSSTHSQHFAIIALKNNLMYPYLNQVLKEYMRKRDLVINTLKKVLPEAKTNVPQAGLYLFVNLQEYLNEMNMNDIDFTFELAEKKGVIMLPGTAFGENGKGHIRITFVTLPNEELVEGIELLGEFVEEKMK